MNYHGVLPHVLSLHRLNKFPDIAVSVDETVHCRVGFFCFVVV